MIKMEIGKIIGHNFQVVLGGLYPICDIQTGELIYFVLVTQEGQKIVDFDFNGYTRSFKKPKDD